MADNSRHQHGRDRQSDRNGESERSRNDNRQYTSGNEIDSDNNTPDSGHREDRISTIVPDNYERDSE